MEVETEKKVYNKTKEDKFTKEETKINKNGFNPASPETDENNSVEKQLTPQQTTDEMIKRMKKAQEQVNKTYQIKLAEVETELEKVQSNLANLQKPMQEKKENTKKQQNLQLESFMQDKTIDTTKKRIRYGLDMIESIKQSVTSVDVSKAIELKDSYDKIRQKFRHKEQPVEPNHEFKDYYVKSWQKKQDEEKQNNLKKLEQMSEYLQKKSEEETKKKNEDANLKRFENAKKKMSDQQRQYILKNIMSGNPDLDARKDVDHPWIDFD